MHTITSVKRHCYSIRILYINFDYCIIAILKNCFLGFKCYVLVNTLDTNDKKLLICALNYMVSLYRMTDSDFPVVEITETNEDVGKGAYAKVKKCYLNGSVCALKKPHDILVKQCETEKKTTLKDLALNEAKILRKMNHPNIVQFKGVQISSVNASSPPNIVMELCQKSLRTYIKEGTIPIEHKLAILLDVSNALCHMHTHEVVHCDLTPNNILITEDLKPKIGDFGSAKVIPGCGKLNYPVPGTPSYMPPEALAEHSDKCSYDKKLDIYSFGCVMHFVKTGKDFVPRNKFLQPSQDPLENLIQQCTESNPENRPDSFTVYRLLCNIVDNLNRCETDTSLPAVNSAFPFGASISCKLAFRVTFLMILLLLLITYANIFHCFDTPIILSPFDKVTEKMQKFAEKYSHGFCILLSHYTKLLYQSILSFTFITNGLVGNQSQPTKLYSVQKRLFIGLLLFSWAPLGTPTNTDSGCCTKYTLLPDEEFYMSCLQYGSTGENAIKPPLLLPDQNISYACEKVMMYPLPLLSFSTITETQTSMQSSGHNDDPIISKIDHTQYALSSSNHKVTEDGIDSITGLLQYVYDLVTTMEYKQLCYNLFLNLIYVLQQGFLVEDQCMDLPDTKQISYHVSCSSKDSQSSHKKGSTEGTPHRFTVTHLYACEIKFTSQLIDYNNSVDNDTLGYPFQLTRFIDKDVANDTIPAIIEGSVYMYKDMKYVYSNYTYFLKLCHWNHAQKENTTIVLYYALSGSSMILVSATQKFSLCKFFHITSSHFTIPGLHRKVVYQGSVNFSCKVVKAIKTTEKKLLTTYSKLSQKHSFVHLQNRIYIVNYNKTPMHLNSWYSTGHADNSDVCVQIKFSSNDIVMAKHFFCYKEYGYKKYLNNNFLPLFVVLSVSTFLAVMKYYFSKRIRNIKSAKQILCTRLPGHLNAQRDVTLSLVYYAFAPSVEYLTQLCLCTRPQADCDLRNNYFAITNFYQCLQGMLQENRLLLQNAYFQDLLNINECFNGHFMILRKLRVDLRNNADLRCHLEPGILHDGASHYCAYKLSALVMYCRGEVLSVTAQQYFYGRANSTIASVINNHQPMMSLPPIPSTHSSLYHIDTVISFPEEHNEHDTTPTALVTNRTLNVHQLTEDTHESDSPYNSQHHLITGRNLDLHTINILATDHEDSSQLVGVFSYYLSNTQISADDSNNNANIILQDNGVLGFLAELHHFSQPPLNQVGYYDGDIDFEDESVAAVSVIIQLLFKLW